MASLTPSLCPDRDLEWIAAINQGSEIGVTLTFDRTSPGLRCRAIVISVDNHVIKARSQGVTSVPIIITIHRATGIQCANAQRIFPWDEQAQAAYINRLVKRRINTLKRDLALSVRGPQAATH